MASFKHTTQDGKEITVSLADVNRKSAENLKKTPDGGEVAFKSMKSFVLIGSGHDKNAVDVMNDMQTHHSNVCNNGKIKVTKGSWTGTNPGTLEVTGIKSGGAEFKGTLRTYTKKQVVQKTAVSRIHQAPRGHPDPVRYASPGP
jgi:hypothetical protein